jgi:flagellar hook protein FlgE
MTLRSLYSGISGLRTQANAIDVTGSNIANVNTTGYRRARITFSDSFVQTLRGAVAPNGGNGGLNPLQIGLGVKTDSVDSIFTQGNTQQTGRLLDLAIQGGGFFQLTDGNGGSFFTRAGNFGLDEQGFVTKPGNGLRLVGRTAAIDGTLDETQPPSAIQVDFNTLSPAVPTDNAILGGNLSSNNTASAARSLNTLVTLFNEDGVPLALNEGDTIRLVSGNYDEVPDDPMNPGVTALTQEDVLTLTRSTTLGDLASALRTSLRAQTGSSTLDVTVDSSGALRLESGSETLSNLVITAVDREGAEKTDVRTIFSDSGLDGDLDLGANSSTTTRAMRQADATSSTEVYDSQGNARTVITTFAQDTRNAPVNVNTLLSDLFDDADRSAAIAAGGEIQIVSGTQGATNLATTAPLAITATTTVEDLRAWLEGAITGTVTLTADGSFQIENTSGVDNITDLRIGFDPDGAGAQPVDTSVLTRMLTNRGYGIDTAGTDGFDLAAGTTGETNTLHTGNPINNSWNYQIVVPHDVTSPPTAATGRLVFQANGVFESYGVTDDGTVIASNPIVEFDPDGTNPENGGVDSLTIEFDFTGISQNASATTAAIFNQDGSPVGRLETIDIAPDGTISGVFSNGATRTLAQVLLAGFSNEGGLRREGDNLWVESPNSGEPIVGTPGTLSRGTLSSGELELSNVDISEEFVNLILAQRAFQANARVITTGDETLQELVNLIR